MATPKVWFITGSSAGFGLHMARAALAHGDKVIATLRTPSAIASLSSEYQSTQLLVVQLDVTKPEKIEEAFSQGKAAFGRIDVVFNCAGITQVSEVEGTPDDIARRLFEVNFWGATNVTRVAMKYFRENDPIGGKLLQMSSCAALDAVAISGFYSAAKSALEGMTDSLRKELDPAWNIKIAVLTPGPFLTNVMQTALFAPPHPSYTNPSLITNVIRASSDPSYFDGNPATAVEEFWAVAQMDDPPERLLIHREAIRSAKSKAESLLKSVEEAKEVKDLYLV
ncbi:NAD-P-binding protein [Crucibulum laeve]|uniref:NAD-P-binding protein n=1 Tax=Crucibulum laeve TaxID=68775 RepID=A0A5C3LPM6_9AGAR|nr:NAD-P-binding protein [Crucibulum laeve]